MFYCWDVLLLLLGSDASSGFCCWLLLQAFEAACSTAVQRVASAACSTASSVRLHLSC
ncbi:hypothetical protein SESBI_07526 [Sesbania bispinosa]|nr:hypothetical protein SESBI_07526 [Sesbania bispinosa]